MDEQYALRYAALRAERLGWRDFDHQPRIFTVQPGVPLHFDSNDSLHLLVSVPDGVSVSSDTGFFDARDISGEQSEEFTGRVTIRNRTGTARQVRFMQILPRKPK